LLVARSGRRVLLIPDDADARATWTLPYARLGASSSSRAARGLVSRLVGSAGPQPDPMGSFRHRTFSHPLTYAICPAAPQAAAGAVGLSLSCSPPWWGSSLSPDSPLHSRFTPRFARYDPVRRSRSDSFRGMRRAKSWWT